jgi:hypothetical protein
VTTRLDTEPLTLAQLGAVHGEFRRLGFGPADRAERLEVTAGLARAGGPVGSTRELTMGEAGRVIRALIECPDYDALAVLLGEPEPPRGHGPPVTLAEAIRHLVITLFIAAPAEMGPAMHDSGARNTGSHVRHTAPMRSDLRGHTPGIPAGKRV